MPELTLNGCAPIPLAHYLKALGILRLVSEQIDPATKTAWRDVQFEMSSVLDADGLVKFLLSGYAPTPVLAPWNGDGGFFDSSRRGARETLAQFENSKAARLTGYREAIQTIRQALSGIGMLDKPADTEKDDLIMACRNVLPEPVLAWLDAVSVLTDNGAKFPPLLGTGGNDGSLDFSKNFMQRLTEVMDPATGEPTAESKRWLRASLFAEAAPGLATKAPVGQFFPGAAGGANATSGFDAPPAVNPWDFILMIEGALLFAAASVKRLEGADDGSLVYPFCVRQSGVGYASAAGADEAEARCEMWMPLWSEPTTLAELRAIFSEGRAQVRGEAARTGVDFAQAAVTLGVDRGITAFQRYGFQVRNGLAYFATPLERIVVRRNARVDLLSDIQQWYDRLRQKAGPKANPEPPASVARALNHLERCVMELCRDDAPARLLAVLTALGAAERALARSFRWTTEAYLRPLSGLRPRWLDQADDGSVEYRLARSVAGMRAWVGEETLWLRQHLEPLTMILTKEHSWINWDKTPSNDVVWHDGGLSNALNAIVERRTLRFEKAGTSGWPDWSPRPATMADITAFIERRTNDELLADLIWGLSPVDWAHIPEEVNPPESKDTIPSAFYALLRLCFRRATKGKEEEAIPLAPAILHRAIHGDGKTASELAARRLHASGKAPLVRALPVAGDIARRTAAAILFPISNRDFRLLERMALQQTNQQNT